MLHEAEVTRIDQETIDNFAAELRGRLITSAGNDYDDARDIQCHDRQTPSPYRPLRKRG